jgi:hypothetical protein
MLPACWAKGGQAWPFNFFHLQNEFQNVRDNDRDSVVTVAVTHPLARLFFSSTDLCGT